MSLSIHNQIINSIKARKRGQLIFPNDFLRIGPETAIHQSLSRLVKEGMLLRLAHGIYLYPKIDKELGVLYPSIEEIAEAIAKKEKIRILPTGSYALNKLGLSTQVPTKVVYLTDGKARKLAIGKNTITFKPAVPRKLAAKGKFSSLVIQALEELGRENVTKEVRERLHNVLQMEETSTLRSDAKGAPAWIARILYETTPKMEV